MVSTHTIVLVAGFLAGAVLAAQTEAPGAPFRPDTGGSKTAAAPSPSSQVTPSADDPTAVPRGVITPETRGDIHMARKQYREAIDDYTEMPDSAIKFNKMGIACHQMLDLARAKRWYERAIKANPKYPEAVNNLGTIYYAGKSFRRAVNQYAKALKLAPASASIYSNLGTAYFARKKYAEASAAYQKALELDPEVFEHRSTAGVLLQERTVQERAKFHYYLAKTYAKAGQVDRAMLYIRKALEEGFKERNKFQEDPEFAGLRELKEFKELMASEPRVL